MVEGVVQQMSEPRYVTYRKKDWPAGRTECGVVKDESAAGYTVRLPGGDMAFAHVTEVLHIDKKTVESMEDEELIEEIGWIIDQTDPWMGLQGPHLTGRQACLSRAAFRELRSRFSVGAE